MPSIVRPTLRPVCIATASGMVYRSPIPSYRAVSKLWPTLRDFLESTLVMNRGRLRRTLVQLLGEVHLDLGTGQNAVVIDVDLVEGRVHFRRADGIRGRDRFDGCDGLDGLDGLDGR